MSKKKVTDVPKNLFQKVIYLNNVFLSNEYRFLLDIHMSCKVQQSMFVKALEILTVVETKFLLEIKKTQINSILKNIQWVPTI